MNRSAPLSVQWRNTAEKYGVIHKAFHWLIAALIIANLVLGLIASDAAMSPAKFRMFFWHKSIGMTVLALGALRLCWKLVNAKPEENPDHPAYERGLAKLVHVLLYVCMITIPLSGWLMSSAKGISVSVFGWFTAPDLMPKNHALGEALETYHIYAAWALIGLIVLHVVGALKHHIWDRDDTLRRMLPFGRVKAASLAALFLFARTTHAAPMIPWTIDHAHSHLAFTMTQNSAPFTGTFAKFDGMIAFDPADLADSHVAITIPLGSLTTGSEERDPYIGQAAWLDTAKFPVATFTVDPKQGDLKLFTAAGNGQYVAHGKLTLHGVTVPVDLPFTYIESPDHKTATAHGTVTLNRLTFGIGTGEWADPKTVGTDVKVDVLVVAHRS